MENLISSSRQPGFYKLSVEQRQHNLTKEKALSSKDLKNIASDSLSLATADKMIENVIGIHGLPLGVGLNFQVNGTDILVPMAVEEPSIVAGASFMAKLVREGGGFIAETTAPEMIGQIQVLDLGDLDVAEKKILENKQYLISILNDIDSTLIRLGGGAKDIEVRKFKDSPIGEFLVVHVIYDVRDAMGANAVNSACERLAPHIEAITNGRVHLRILSNLSDKRLVKAQCLIPVEALAFNQYTGEEVRDGIIEAWAFAAVDPYRAATHNKGVMNGIDSVVVATGNDWRAIEAGAHAYAAKDGHYTSLTKWGKDEYGNLIGLIELPMAVGIVGGNTSAHPTAKTSLKMMGVETASELAQVIASVGLAQNLAALRALATEGIQKGHMSLHARQVAIAAGAKGSMIEQLAEKLILEKNIRVEHAKSLLQVIGN